MAVNVLKRHIQFQVHIIDKSIRRYEINKKFFILCCLIDKSASDLCEPIWFTKTLGNDHPIKRCFMPEESNP